MAFGAGHFRPFGCSGHAGHAGRVGYTAPRGCVVKCNSRGCAGSDLGQPESAGQSEPRAETVAHEARGATPRGLNGSAVA
jgi:hypothetical protein